MKTIYRLDGKRISKKALIEGFGAERIKCLTEEAKETFKDTLINFPKTKNKKILKYKKSIPMLLILWYN